MTPPASTQPGSAHPPSGPPAGRYGAASRSRRVALTAAVVVIASAFGAWLLWAALGAATPAVRSELLGYDVIDDAHVEVRFVVIASRDKTVTCSVEALDRDRELVGTTLVRVPPAQDDRRIVEHVLKTRDRAMAATLRGCRVA